MEKPNKRLEITPMRLSEFPRREDVVGDAGKFVDDFIEAMNSEKIYKTMGVNPDKSFLITGRPGNGKTMGIEALINETNRNAYEILMSDSEELPKLSLVGFKYDIGSYGTPYINEGSRVVQEFFNMCFTTSRSGYKTLAVFDEAEVLFGKRIARTNHKEDSKVLETIMKNMQIAHNMDNLYTVMMSNFPEAFDEASIRSGRVDKKFQFNNPNLKEREFAYNQIIRRLNERAGYKVIRGENVKSLAGISNNFSYSDITESVNSAVKKRAKEISETRKDKIVTIGYITQKRLENAIENHKTKFITRTKRNRIGFI